MCGGGLIWGFNLEVLGDGGCRCAVGGDGGGGGVAGRLCVVGG